MVECKICNKKLESAKFLMHHIKEHNISYQDYLKTYVYKSFKYYNIQINPGICPICGNSIKLKHHKLQKFCCKKCQNIFFQTSKAYKQSNIEKAKQTCKSKYGVENVMGSNLFRQKIKNTKFKKYGDSNYNNRDLAKETCLKKFGVENQNQCDFIKEAKRQSFINKYGVDNPAKIDGISDKIKETKLKKYGDSNYNNRDLAKQTCADLYGDSNYNNRPKAKQTTLDLYGVENYSNSLERKERELEIQDKINDTKRLHNSFHTSTPENNLYNLLLTKFKSDDIIRQYKSDLYPFACDFYVKSLDLYVELQGTWLHGSEPYNSKNPEHIKIVNEWKSRSTSHKTNFYEVAIKTWTIRDPLKRKTALKSNLNYIEVFDFKTFKELKNLFKDLNLNNE